MSQYWFKPKTHGYGATPANWQGWLASAIFALAVVILAPLPILASHDGPTSWQILAWALAITVVSAGFVVLARAKTDGQWRWRWGK